MIPCYHTHVCLVHDPQIMVVSFPSSSSLGHHKYSHGQDVAWEASLCISTHCATGFLRCACTSLPEWLCVWQTTNLIEDLLSWKPQSLTGLPEYLCMTLRIFLSLSSMLLLLFSFSQILIPDTNFSRAWRLSWCDAITLMQAVDRETVAPLTPTDEIDSRQEERGSRTTIYRAVVQCWMRQQPHIIHTVPLWHQKTRRCRLLQDWGSDITVTCKMFYPTAN